MKIIFGGSFDPVHVGHLRVATELSELFNGCEVALLPCKLPVHKAATFLPAAQRLSLLRAAVAADDDLGGMPLNGSHLTLDERELARESESFTYTTLCELKAEGQSVVLSVGTDAALSLASWHRSEAFFELCNLVILQRPGYQHEELTKVLTLLGFDVVTDVDQLQAATEGKALLVPVTQLDISSSDIRVRAAKGKSVRYLVPDAVNRIICDNHFFR